MSKRHSIKLSRLICNKTSEAAGPDDVYVQYQADAGVSKFIPTARAAVKMDENDVMYFADDGAGAPGSYITIEFDYELIIMVFDRDRRINPSKDTFLVNFNFLPGRVGESNSASQDLQFTRLNKNGADYSLVYNTWGCDI